MEQKNTIEEKSRNHKHARLFLILLDVYLKNRMWPEHSNCSFMLSQKTKDRSKTKLTV